MGLKGWGFEAHGIALSFMPCPALRNEHDEMQWSGLDNLDRVLGYMIIVIATTVVGKAPYTLHPEPQTPNPSCQTPNRQLRC